MSPTKKTLVLGITYKHNKTNHLVCVLGFPNLKIGGEEWARGVYYISLTKTGSTSVRSFDDFVSNFQIVRKRVSE